MEPSVIGAAAHPPGGRELRTSREAHVIVLVAALFL
jgi:hypothetical protein